MDERSPWEDTVPDLDEKRLQRWCIGHEADAVHRNPLPPILLAMSVEPTIFRGAIEIACRLRTNGRWSQDASQGKTVGIHRLLLKSHSNQAPRCGDPVGLD